MVDLTQQLNMAGRPRRKSVLNRLKARAVDEIGPDATALDYVASWLADGKTLVALAREIGASPNAVRDALAAEHGDRDGVNARLTRARAIGATVLLEQTQAIADGVREDKNAIAKAKLQVEVRKALAAFYNPEQFGERRGPAVQISIGAMHLDAVRLRSVQGISNPQPQALPAAEVLTVQEDTGAAPNDEVGEYVEYPPAGPTG